MHRGAVDQGGGKTEGLPTRGAPDRRGEYLRVLVLNNDASYGAAREARSPITDAEFR